MRARSLPVLAALVLLLGLFAATPAFAATTHVVDDDAGTCVYGPADFTSIEAAVIAASDGDTIQVCPGTYNEEVRVDKTLEILGARAGVQGRTRTVDDDTIESILEPVESGGNAFIVVAPNVILSGFWIRDYTHGVFADYEAAGLRILENVFESNSIGADVLSTGTITARNAFRDNNAGVFQVGSKATIAGNEFLGSAVGVYIDGGIGIRGFSSGEDIRIRNNTFESGVPGVFESGPAGAIRASYTTGLRILDNVMDSGGSGVWLRHGNDAVTIERNSISNFEFAGIELGGGLVVAQYEEPNGQFEILNGPITVKRNTITDNGNGVLVHYDSLRTSMVLRENVIAGNSGFSSSGEPSTATVIGGAGVANYDDTQVDAARNWWGDASGPSGWSIGTGDYVTDKVRFFPWATNPTFTAFAQCTQTGGSGNDHLVGTAGVDILCGRGGQDKLEGRGEKDLLIGEGGSDLLLGGGGDDALLGGEGNDNLRGNAGFDSLQGHSGTDVCLPGPDGGQTSTCE